MARATSSQLRLSSAVGRSETDRTERLHELAAALAGALTVRQVVSAIVEHTMRAFDGVGAVVARRTEDGTRIEILEARDMPGDDVSEWRLFPLSAPVPLAYVTRTGKAVFLESAMDWEQHFPETSASARGADHPAHIVVPIFAGGRPSGAIGVAFDRPRIFNEGDRALAVTVARQCSVALERAGLFEAERAARTEAENANQAKTAFLTAMSHELRTPLNAIAGYAELLTMGIYGPVAVTQREALERIKRSQKHLLGLINDVLNFAKLDAGQLQLCMVNTDLQAEFDYVSDIIAPQILEKKLTYEHCRCAPDTLVRADPEKLRQVLLNLFSNAIKFTDQGVIRSWCDVDEERGKVFIHISDTGCGIPVDRLASVFEPFVQLERRLNHPIEGTGLGLAISRELARAMVGNIVVESEEGVGSTFILEMLLAS